MILKIFNRLKEARSARSLQLEVRGPKLKEDLLILNPHEQLIQNPFEVCPDLPEVDWSWIRIRPASPSEEEVSRRNEMLRECTEQELFRDQVSSAHEFYKEQLLFEARTLAEKFRKKEEKVAAMFDKIDLLRETALAHFRKLREKVESIESDIEKYTRKRENAFFPFTRWWYRRKVSSLEKELVDTTTDIDLSVKIHNVVAEQRLDLNSHAGKVRDIARRSAEFASSLQTQELTKLPMHSDNNDTIILLRDRYARYLDSRSSCKELFSRISLIRGEDGGFMERLKVRREMHAWINSMHMRGGMQLSGELPNR